MKIEPTLYRGIEFVKISELPQEQQTLLQLTPNHPERIKLLINGKISEPCIVYKAYLEWYTRSVKQTVRIGQENSSGSGISVPVQNK